VRAVVRRGCDTKLGKGRFFDPRRNRRAEADPGAPASDEAGPPSPAAVIPGTTGNDSLTGTAADDTIFTGEGNDFLDGRGGDDLLLGGNDGDTLLGGLGNDLLFGERGGDTIDGGDGDDILIGELGDDILDGGGGDFDIASYVLSPGGVTVNLDTVARSGVGASRVLDGHGTTDQLTGIEEVQRSDFGDRVFGGPTNDVLVGWDGADTLLGGAGADLIEGGEGNDELDGEAGDFDAAAYLFSLAAVTVNLDTVTRFGISGGTALDGFGSTDTLISIEIVDGSDFADRIAGGSGNNVLVGGAGGDTLLGGGGGDVIEGAQGNDQLNGEGGTFDAAGYGFSPSAVTVNLDTIARFGIAGGTALDGWGTTDTLTEFERVIGSDHGDRVAGGKGDEFLFGGLGDDTLFGGDGTDQLIGEAGDDLLEGDSGNDVLDGGGGDDEAYYVESVSGVTVNLDTATRFGIAGGTALDGSGGTDALISIELVRGSDFDDRLAGGTGDNILSGGNGDDTLFGGDGVDQLLGDDGADSLVGDAGDDLLEGGAGNDVLDGGAGDGDEAYYAESGSGVVVNLDTAAHFGVSGGTALDGVGGTDTLISIKLVSGSPIADRVAGGAANDVLGGGLGGDTLVGGAGDDLIDGGEGDDQLDGGDGFSDGVSHVLDPRGGTVNLDTVAQFGVAGGTAVDGWGTTDTLSGFEQVVGSEFGDRIASGAGSEVLDGAAGGDTLLGRGGHDLLIGGEGGDTLDGGDGHDRILYNYDEANGGLFGVTVDLGNGTATDGFGDTDSLIDTESVRGTSFADTLIGGRDLDEHFGEEFVGLSGDDTISGLGGWDFVDYSADERFGGLAGVTVHLGLGTATDGFGDTDTLSGIEFIVGTAFADTLTGGDAGGDFGWFLEIGGLEEFRALAGDDTLDGGDGFDYADYREDEIYGGAAGVTVNLAAGTATDSFGDTDSLANIEGAVGGSSDDTLIGGNAANDALEMFRGRDGADTIDGGSGFDRAVYANEPFAGGTLGVVVDLAAGTATDSFGNIDTLIAIEGVWGTEFADTLAGGNAARFV